VKPEIQKLWVGALRSGEYKQAQSVLRTESGMCCLGVLCDLYKKTEGKGEWLGSSFLDPGDYESDTELTDSVGVWAGISQNNPAVPVVSTRYPLSGTSVKTLLSEMNDGDFTFLQIADVIEHFGHEL
jgi:hypothetical protein